MKVIILVSIFACVLPALAAFNGQAIAATIDKQSANVPKGKYRFRNVKTGQYLKYVRSGQQLYPSGGSGSYLSVSNHEKHVIISPSNSNSKCISAAWSYKNGADSAAALYACVHLKRDQMPTGSDPVERDIMFSDLDLEERDEQSTDRLEKRVKLRTSKQFFYVHPASKRAHAYHIVAVDHITDQKTRVLGGSSAPAEWSKSTRYTNIVALNENDKSQMWELIKPNGKRL